MRTADVLRVLLVLAPGPLQFSCLPHRVDVQLPATTTPGEFCLDSVGTLRVPIPPYPDMMRFACIEGDCGISVLLGRNLTAESAWVSAAADYWTLDSAAIQAARGCRFVPAHGRQIRRPLRVDLVYRFMFEDHTYHRNPWDYKVRVDVRTARLYTYQTRR